MLTSDEDEATKGSVLSGRHARTTALRAAKASS
jgi:hypothetical protein